MRDWTYRHYVANSLRLLPDRKYLSMTLDEALNPPPEINMTGDEVLEELLQKGAIRFKE